MSDYGYRNKCRKCGAMEGHGECSLCSPSFPEFWEWKQDLTVKRQSELVCQFYEDNIGMLYKDKIEYIFSFKKRYELAEDAEDLILEGILDGNFFESEWDSFLKGWYEEERGGKWTHLTSSLC